MVSTQFSKLSHEKQKLILDIALQEFADYGYDLASTNRIIMNCEISKGVLFKYFGDKEGLFIAICEYGLNDYADAIVIRPYSDIFECIKDLGSQKVRWLHERPITYRLIMRIIKEPSHPVYSKVLALASKVSSKQVQAIQALLPVKGLKPGISPERVLSAIIWISQGLQDKYTNELPDSVTDNYESYYQRLSDEMDDYFNILKNGFFEIETKENH